MVNYFITNGKIQWNGNLSLSYQIITIVCIHFYDCFQERLMPFVVKSILQKGFVSYTYIYIYFKYNVGYMKA